MLFGKLFNDAVLDSVREEWAGLSAAEQVEWSDLQGNLLDSVNSNQSSMLIVGMVCALLGV